MKYLSIIITLVMCGTMTEVSAQRICGSTMDLSAIQFNDPARYQRIMQMEQQVLSYNTNRQQSLTSQQIITIPVVVHVLHTGQAMGTGLNISDAQVQSQIDVLNEDFRRLNADATNTPTEFQSVAAAVEIEFVLACVDPNGNPTEGIMRVQTNVNTFTRIPNVDGSTNEVATGIKFAPTGSPAWPSDQYLNIWVCNLGNGLLGYAQFPDQMATQPETDGVVIRTTSFGRIGNVAAPFHKGRTATHEVGHWLNLRHIWGDANCGNDLVADTPVQSGSTSSGFCSHPRTTCGSHDMFQNYMDYTDDACMNLFTTGQSDRMRALFSSGGVREGFVLPISITGSTLLCSTNQPYSVSIVPPGATVSWSVSPTSLFAVDSGTGSTFTTRATNSLVSGVGIITATINWCGTVTVVPNPFDVWVGKPVLQSAELDLRPGIPLLLSTSINSVCKSTIYKTVMDIRGNNTSVTWQKITSSPGYISWYQNGNNIQFTLQNINNSATFRMTATNTCGSIVYDFKFKAIDCQEDPCAQSQYTVSPNPAQKNIDIAPNLIGGPEPCPTASPLVGSNSEELMKIESIALYSLDGNLVEDRKLSGNSEKTQLNVVHLQEGIYLLKITNGMGSELHRVVIDR